MKFEILFQSRFFLDRDFLEEIKYRALRMEKGEKSTVWVAGVGIQDLGRKQ